LALLALAQNVVVHSGFLDPPATPDLNGRNLSALYEIVDSRERNSQVLGRLFYGSSVRPSVERVENGLALSLKGLITDRGFDNKTNVTWLEGLSSSGTVMERVP